MTTLFQTFRPRALAASFVLAALFAAPPTELRAGDYGLPLTHATYAKNIRPGMPWSPHMSFSHPPRVYVYHPGYLDAVPSGYGDQGGGWGYGGYGHHGFHTGYGNPNSNGGAAHFDYHPSVTSDYGYVGQHYPHPYSFGTYYSPIGGYQDSYFHPYYTAHFGIGGHYGPIWHGTR